MKAFRYRVEIDGFARLGFAEVSGPEVEVDVVEYGEGGSETNQKSAGRTKFSDITLARGQIIGQPGDDDFKTWIEQVHLQGVQGNPGEYRRDIDVVQFDATGAEVKRWTFEQCWPSKYKGASDFNAMSSENSIESLTITNEGWTQS